MPTALMTGFPGFLGSGLLPRLLSARPDLRVRCLVQPRWEPLARRTLEGIERARPELAGRTRLDAGDIRHADLGLADSADARREVREVFHLAAVYDLSVPPGRARAVNVEGTRNVLAWARGSGRLERFHHVSTCYVSGTRAGTVREDELVEGQAFRNAYEETKYRAEVLVRDAAEAGVPVTVYRPAAVVGDSGDGATPKLDGPYMFIRLVLRQGRTAFVPVSGDVEATRVNVVPRDFVTSAIAALSGMPRSRGRTYHLADPQPETVAAMLDRIGEAAGARIVRVPLPEAVARAALRVRPLRAWMGIPPEAVAYYGHRGRFDVTAARSDLAGTGVECPPFASYVRALVEFTRAHPALGRRAMT